MKKYTSILFFVLSLGMGLLIFVVFSHMRPVFAENIDLPLRLGLILILLIAVVLTKRKTRLKQPQQLLLACLTASTALLLDLYLPTSRRLLQILNIELHTPTGLALDKLDSSLVISLTILLLNRISGNSLGSIYLQKGLLRLGLRIGLTGFFVFALVSIPLSEWFFGAKNISIASAIPWIPWILVFILGNAFNEELLFRGLFLKRLAPFLKPFPANLLIGLIFTLHHTGVGYTPDILLFFAFLLPLALAWGAIMQKTDSLWGSVLFHAGADIPVVLAIFSNL